MAITFAFLQIDGICFVCVTYQCCHTKRSFHLIKPGDINRSVSPYNCARDETVAQCEESGDQRDSHT